jgi:hypothetical protein
MNPIICEEADKLRDGINQLNETDPLVLEEKMRALSMNFLAKTLPAKIESLYDVKAATIVVNNAIYYCKGSSPEVYQSSVGKIKIDRHVYQSMEGGPLYVPLEDKFNMIKNATPLFAKMAAFKFANMSSCMSETDFKNHGISVSRSYIHDIATVVGQEIQKHSGFNYEIPELPSDVKNISVSLDGTTVLTRESGYKEVMVGKIDLLDEEGQRMHSITFGDGPEQGKQSFLNRMYSELNIIKNDCPEIPVQGIADGAQINWTFLDENTDIQVLDYYHLSEHINNAANSLFKKQKEKYEWLEYWLHKVKHTNIGGSELADDISNRLPNYKGKNRDTIEKELNYIRNQLDRMHYWTERHNKRPIGSGAIESACKTLIKQRFGISGAKWSTEGVHTLIALRGLILTVGRYDQFWQKANSYCFHKNRKKK